MRRIRVLSIIIFVLSVGVFVYFNLLEKKSVDTNGPEIHMQEDSIEVSVSSGSDEILAGVTASDLKDGDVSGSLVIESMANFTERGRRMVTFAAFDSDSNVTKARREIIYSDYTPPSFSLDAPLYFPVNTESFADELTVKDVLDGDLTKNIKMSSENGVQINTEGDYQVVFSVSNSAGDSVQLPVTVTIYKPSENQALPLISLSQYLVHIQKGEIIDPWSYVDEVRYKGTIYKPQTDSEGGQILVEDNADGTESSGSLYGMGNSGDTESLESRKYLRDIEIANPVDSNTPGTYEITYSVTSEEEHEQNTGTMRLIVVVDDQGV